MSYINPSGKLSIITVTYNNVKGLEQALISVGQSNESTQFLIIDGGSTDGTIDLLKKYAKTIPNLAYISELDQGIYDAMNKGLRMASGEYVIFMNAGDRFYAKDTIKNILQIIDDECPDIIYSETMMITPDGKDIGLRSDVTTRRLPKKLTWQSLKKGMLVCHQSFVVKRELAPLYIEDNLSADIDWMIKCLKNAKSIYIHPGVISRFETGGVSQQKRLKSLIDRAKVLKNHYGIMHTIYSHFYFIIRAVLFRLGIRL